MSGVSFMKINDAVKQTDGMIDFTKEVFNDLNTFSCHHDIGILYNGMTEKHMANTLKDYHDVVHSIHSDSGGLQIAQQGKTLTSELEDKIYATQLAGSHVAMSFDFIPIKVIAPGDPRTNMEIKRFIHTEVDDYGKKSGECVRRQLEYFATHDNIYNTSPLIILHGNSQEDYKRYFDALIKEIPEEYYPFIGGYALAGTGIGIGQLEAVDSIYSFDMVDKPDEIKKRIHFLGYGSISRLIPVITAYENGILSDYYVSYDSTSHTSGFVYGRMLGEEGDTLSVGMIPHNAKAKDIFGKVYDAYENIIVKHLEVTRDEWIKYTTKDLTSSARYKGNDISAKCNTAGAVLAGAWSVKNFIKSVDVVIDDFENIQNIGNIKNYPVFKCLLECKTGHDWFNNYRGQVDKYLDSKRIKRVASLEEVITLEHLFG